MECQALTGQNNSINSFLFSKLTKGQLMLKYYKEMISEFSVSANPSNQMDNYDIVLNCFVQDCSKNSVCKNDGK